MPDQWRYMCKYVTVCKGWNIIEECIAHHFQLYKHIFSLLKGLKTSVFFYRSLFEGELFGLNPIDEVEMLLFIYCKHKSESTPGWYITQFFTPDKHLFTSEKMLVRCKKHISSKTLEIWMSLFKKFMKIMKNCFSI